MNYRIVRDTNSLTYPFVIQVKTKGIWVSKTKASSYDIAKQYLNSILK